MSKSAKTKRERRLPNGLPTVKRAVPAILWRRVQKLAEEKGVSANKVLAELIAESLEQRMVVNLPPIHTTVGQVFLASPGFETWLKNHPDRNDEAAKALRSLIDRKLKEMVNFDNEPNV